MVASASPPPNQSPIFGISKFNGCCGCCCDFSSTPWLHSQTPRVQPPLQLSPQSRHEHATNAFHRENKTLLPRCAPRGLEDASSSSSSCQQHHHHHFFSRHCRRSAAQPPRREC